MRRKCLSVAFSVVLALSVWGNSVYASGMESAGVTGVVAEAEESAEALTEESDTEESTEEFTEDDTGTEESAEESTEASTEEDKSQGEAADVPDGDDNTSNESAEDEIGESLEAPAEDAAESEEADVPGESEEDVSEAEEPELKGDGEFISDEEISEVYYGLFTSDGWGFYVNNNYAVITSFNGKNTVLNIPDTVVDKETGNSYVVKMIGFDAFYYNKSITAVTVPDSVTRIGKCAFQYCSNLEKIHLGNGVTTIDDYAFAGSGITGISLPKSVSSLGKFVLMNCDHLGAIQLDCQITKIPEGFANGCDNLTSVLLGDKIVSYTHSDYYPFQDTPMLRAAYVGNSSLSDDAFYKSGIENGGTIYHPNSPLPSISKPRLQVVEDADSRSVLMTTDTPGAIIFYSTTGSSMNLETDWMASGNNVDFTHFKGTVYARTYLCGKWSDVASITLPEKKLSQQPTFAVKGVFGGREVTFNTTHEDAAIYYSTKGSTDITIGSDRVENGQTVLFKNFYGSVYAKTYYNGLWSDASRLILKIPVVNDPTITYSDDKVTIRTTTPNAFIYYTTDGSTPSIHNGKRLSNSGGTFTLSSGTVKAIAVRSCFTDSNVVSRKITPVVDSSIKVPSFQVKGVIGGRTVTFNTAQKGAVIYYSSSSSTLTTADKKVSIGQSVTFENFYGTIYARTYYNGKWSNVARLILKIPVVNQPTIQSNGNGYYTISTSTPSCTIYYTTDGSTPSPTNGRKINASSSKVYIGNYYRIRAIAVRSCFTNSPVATYY